jgi:hypothetical protein
VHKRVKLTTEIRQLEVEAEIATDREKVKLAPAVIQIEDTSL